MAGTLTINYLKEMRKANVEPIVQVAIGLSSPSSNPMYFSNAHHTTDYDVSPTPMPILVSVTDVAVEIDPVKRHFQTGSIQIEILDDPYVRSVISSHNWHGATVLVTVGTPILTSSDYATVFYGMVDRVYGQHDRIFIDCLTVNTKMTRDFRKVFSSKHPMEALQEVMNEAGIPDSQIETSTFAPGFISNYSHYCFSSYGFGVFTRGGNELATLQEPPGSISEDADYVRIGVSQTGINGSTTYQDVIVMNPKEFADEYCEFTGTVLYNDTASKVKLNFADKTAAVTKHLTTDEYWDFEQDPETLVFNRVKVNVGGGSNGVQIDLKDSASITKYGERVYETEARYFANGGFISHENQITATTATPYGFGINGFAGARNLKAGTQTSADLIDSGNPFYMYWRGGIYKSVTAHTDAEPTANSALFELPNFTNPWDTTFVNGVFKLGISGLVHQGGMSFGSGHSQFVFDITMVYQFCERVLDRYSNTAPKISFVTTLEFLNLELGDTISIDNDWFAAPELDLDGLDSNTKFEITKKEVRPCGSDIGIYFEAYYLTTSSPPSTTIAILDPPDIVKYPIRQSLGMAFDLNTNSRNSTSTGMNLTATSGLGYQINVGVAIAAGAARRLEEAITMTATANKDTYVALDSFTGNFVIHELANGATPPLLQNDGQIMLGKVVSGSSVSSISDLRSFGAIGIEQINTDMLIPGLSILWNPSFDIWENSGEFPPGWGTGPTCGNVSGVVGTDILKSETTKAGRYSLEAANTSTNVRFTSIMIPVDSLKVYRFSIWLKQLASFSIVVSAYWFQDDRSASGVSSFTTIFNGNLGGSTAWIQKSATLTPPSDAAYCRIDLYRGASPGGSCYFDEIEFREQPPSFRIFAPATTVLTKGTFHLIQFNSEEYDHGGNFGSFKFTAPEDGLYQFECQIVATPTSSSFAFGDYAEMYFEKISGGSSSTFGRTVEGAAASTVLAISSLDTIELIAGDTVHVEFQSAGENVTLTNTAPYTWFSGRKLS